MNLVAQAREALMGMTEIELKGNIGATKLQVDQRGAIYVTNPVAGPLHIRLVKEGKHLINFLELLISRIIQLLYKSINHF